MANNFRIVISATDKATASIKKVNDSISKMTRPFAEMRRSTKALGRELRFEKIGRSLKNIKSSAGDLASKISSIAAPMAALATSWSRLATEVSKTSGLLGASSSDLQSLQGAARLAGVSSEALTGSLKSLGDTMNDAVNGRNQDALIMMNNLGIELHRTSSGAVDTKRAFLDLSKALQQYNPQTQAFIARTLGAESSLALLQKGPGTIQELMKRMERFGAIMGGPAQAAGRRFSESLVDLDFAMSGLRNAISEKLVPILQPMLDQFNNWIAKNRELIALKISDWGERLAKWVNTVDFAKLGKDAGWVAEKIVNLIDKIILLIDKLGGLKAVAIGVGAILTANLAGNLAGLALAIGRIGALVALTGPIGALAVAITAFVAAVAGLKLVKSLSKNSNASGEFTGGGGRSSGGIGGASGDWGDGPTDSAMARGIRNNNPGNLRSWGSLPRDKDGYAIFPTPEAGLEAMISNLRGYQNRHGIRTIRGVVSRWAPPSENDTASYISDVATSTGIGADEMTDLNNPNTLARLVPAIIRHEGNGAGFTADMIAQAIARHFGGPTSSAQTQGNQTQNIALTINGLPAGVGVTAQTGSGAAIPVQIGVSMPSITY